MKPEYQKVADKWQVMVEDSAVGRATRILLEGAVADCEALAQREWKTLSDAEILNISNKIDQHKWSDLEFGKAIQAAFIKKQSEPETVTVRLLRWSDGSISVIDTGLEKPLMPGESWASDPVEIEMTK